MGRDDSDRAGGNAGDDDRAAIAALVAAGDYVGAALRAEAAGDLRRAIQLLERVWRFADASALAERLGDRPLAVRLALDAGNPTRAAALAARVAPDDADAGAVIDVLATRGRALEAAALAERRGAHARAAELYRRGGALLEAARALERAGAWPEAGRLYEEVAVAAAAQGDARTEAEARLGYGLLCAALGRAREAARALQIAARHPDTRLMALRSLGEQLAALGLPEAAAAIAGRLADAASTAPGSEPVRPSGRAALADEAAATPAPALPRFSQLVLIGGGRLGRVFRAHDRLLDETVVLKIVGVGASGHALEQKAFRQFVREAEASSRLRHPNIVRLFDVDERAGLLVMEYLAGGTLADRLLRGPLSAALARRVALDLLAALDAAHRAGIVHRDVKPSNVFLDAAGNAKLADFGAAHLTDFGGTQTAGFIGTLGYLSPEQISGGTVGAASDLYGLGVTLFEALTGRLPYAGADIAGQHLGSPIPDVRVFAPALAAEHADVLSRALAKRPGDRFVAAQAMAEAVRAWPADLALPGAAGGPEAAREAVEASLPPPSLTPAPLSTGRLVADSATGQLWLADDARVGRPVLVELRSHPLDDDELARVAALAACGGPHVQRVLRRDDARTIIYEWLGDDVVPLAALPAAEAAQLAPAFSALAPCGIMPAATTAIARTPTGPAILVVATVPPGYPAKS